MNAEPLPGDVLTGDGPEPPMGSIVEEASRSVSIVVGRRANARSDDYPWMMTDGSTRTWPFRKVYGNTLYVVRWGAR